MNINAPSSNFYNMPWTKRQDLDESKKKQKRLPLIGRVPNKFRNHFVAMLGEFCGTFLFLFFAFSGTQIANAAAAAETSASSGGNSLPQAPNASVLLYISLVFGFSLAVNAWVFFRISGGMFLLNSNESIVILTASRVIQSCCGTCTGSHRRYNLDTNGACYFFGTPRVNMRIVCCICSLCR